MRTGGEGFSYQQFTGVSGIGQGPEPRVTLSAAAVARAIGKSRRSVDRWGREGLYPKYRVGRQWRYILAEVRHSLPRHDRRRPDVTRSATAVRAGGER